MRIWPKDEFDDLMSEYNLDKTAEWNGPEKFFIDLGGKKKMETRFELWLFKL